MGRDAGTYSQRPPCVNAVSLQADRVKLLDQALDMTHRMLQDGEAGEWQQVIEQEQQRRQLLEQAFSTREPLNEVLAATVRRILELDKVLLEASSRERDEVGGELSRYNRGSRASDAYRANTA